MKEIDYLQVFVAVVNWGSFSEAARKMNQPTTTISRKIQQLESELNCKLFHRTTRSLSLTEMGERMLPKAKLILETTREMKNDVESFADTPTGRLHISSSTTVLEQVSPLLADFIKRYPNITYELESASRNVDLAERGVDFAFRLGPFKDSSLVSLPLAPLRYVLVGEQSFVHARPDLSHPNDLYHWPCIRSHIEGMLYPWHFSKNGETFTLDSENYLLSNDLRVCTQMVVKGPGLAYLPIRLVQKYLNDGRLVSVLDDWMPEDRVLNLVYSNRKNLPSKSRAFIEFVRNNRQQIDTAINTEELSIF